MIFALNINFVAIFFVLTLVKRDCKESVQHFFLCWRYKVHETAITPTYNTFTLFLFGNIYMPMLPGGDESPLHTLCFVCLGTSQDPGVDMLTYPSTVVPYDRRSLLLMNATFQELTLVTSENLILFKVLW